MMMANTIEPIFATPERPSKLDPFAEKLAAWLKTEAGKSRKERRTLKQLHGDLVALGFTGSYGRVAAFARPTYFSNWTGRAAATYTSPDLTSNGGHVTGLLEARYRSSYFLTSTPLRNLAGQEVLDALYQAKQSGRNQVVLATGTAAQGA